MPLYNDIGDPLPKIVLNQKEKNRQFYLSGLSYPEHKERIFHLSPEDFRIWLYMINPRDALLLTSTYGISQRIRKQLKTWRLSRISDWLWRIFN